MYELVSSPPFSLVARGSRSGLVGCFSVGVGMRTTAHQQIDFCHRCGNTVHVIAQEQDSDGVWHDVTKCEHCKQVSPGADADGCVVDAHLQVNHRGGVSGEDLRSAVGDLGKYR